MNQRIKLLGHSLAELLMVIFIIAIVTIIAIPMMTVRKVGEYDFNTIRCVRQELAADLNSPACSASIRDALSGVNQAVKTLIITADSQSRQICEGKSCFTPANFVDKGTGTPIKVAALKTLREVCDRGGDEACKYFVNDCKKNIFACNRTDAVVTDFDLNFYLGLPDNDSSNLGRMKILQIVSNQYLNGMSYPSGAYKNILNTVEGACNGTNNTACEIIRKNAKRQVYDFTNFEKADFIQEDAEDGTMFLNGNIMLSDKSPVYSFSNPSSMEYFNIDSVPYFVVGGASADSVIYKWNSSLGRFSQFQTFSAAKNVKHINAGGTDYLYYISGNNLYSCKWNGNGFDTSTSVITDPAMSSGLDYFINAGNTYVVTTNSSGSSWGVNISKIYPTPVSAGIQKLSAISNSGVQKFTLLNTGTDLILAQSNTDAASPTLKIYKWNGVGFDFIQSFTKDYNNVVAYSLDSFNFSGNSYIAESEYRASVTPTLKIYKLNPGGSFDLIQTKNSLGSYISYGSSAGSDHILIGDDFYFTSVISRSSGALYTHKWNGTGFDLLNSQVYSTESFKNIEAFASGGKSYLAASNSANNYIKFLRWNGSAFADLKSFYYLTTGDNNRINASKVLFINGVQNVPTGASLNWKISTNRKNSWQYYNGTGWDSTTLSSTSFSVGSTYEQMRMGLRNMTLGENNFDLGFQMQTFDSNNNPSIDRIEVYYR